MAEYDNRTISISDYLGVDPKEIPPITTFVSRATSPKTRHTVDPQREVPQWAAKLLTISEGVAKKSGMSVVIAEISVLTDAVDQSPSPGDGFFTTNIVCRSESGTAMGDPPLLTAYRHAIRTISTGGTTMNTPEFHALHCVYVSSTGPAAMGGGSPDGAVSFYRDTVKATPLAVIYREDRTIDFDKHHRDFFEDFIAEFIKTTRPYVSGEIFRQLHYIAVPFQRPEHLSVFTDIQSPARLEPAGAFYLILQPDQEARSHAEQIEAIAAKLQYICALSCLKASSLLADRSMMNANTNAARLIAYDGIGHALRAFVEATKYEGAIALLSSVQHDNRLPPDLVKKVAHVGRSLAFFEHAEGLGSLMRLHGWLEAHESGLKKVIGCFDETKVQEIRKGQMSSDTIAAAASEVTVPLASALAYKDDVTFRIEHRAGQPPCIRSVLITPDLKMSDEIAPKPAFPPLKTEGDERAVLLALNVALLEPLRNASMHLARHSANSEAVVLITGGVDGVVNVHIGNEWYGEDPAQVDLLSLSTGIRLVSGLLSDCYLGKFFKVKAENLAVEFPSIEDKSKYQDYVWIGIEITPLALYEFAKNALKAL